MLDWGKPGKSFVISVGAVAFVFFMHCLVHSMYRLKIFIFSRICKRNHEGDKMPALTRTVSSLESAQREQFLNPSAIIDLKL